MHFGFDFAFGSVLNVFEIGGLDQIPKKFFELFFRAILVAQISDREKMRALINSMISQSSNDDRFSISFHSIACHAFRSQIDRDPYIAISGN